MKKELISSVGYYGDQLVTKFIKTPHFPPKLIIIRTLKTLTQPHS